MDTVVIYKVNPESLQTVLGLLRKEGFDPTTVEDPSAGAALSGCGKAAYLISVAVPRDQAPAAEKLLRDWDQTQLPKVKGLVGRLAGPFLASAAVVGIAAFVLLLLGILSEAMTLLFAAWVVLFALLANAERMAERLRRTRNR